jgi:hypothetical protein
MATTYRSPLPRDKNLRGPAYTIRFSVAHFTPPLVQHPMVKGPTGRSGSRSVTGHTLGKSRTSIEVTP